MERTIKAGTPACPFCGKTHVVMIDTAGLLNYKNGALIGTAFPYLTADERELLISGTCPECWEKYMKEDEE